MAYKRRPARRWSGCPSRSVMMAGYSVPTNMMINAVARQGRCSGELTGALAGGSFFMTSLGQPSWPRGALLRFRPTSHSSLQARPQTQHPESKRSTTWFDSISIREGSPKVDTHISEMRLVSSVIIGPDVSHRDLASHHSIGPTGVNNNQWHEDHRGPEHQTKRQVT